MGPPQQQDTQRTIDWAARPTPSALAIRTDIRNGVVRVALEGEFDLAAVPRLESCLSGLSMDGDPGSLLIDLRDVTFIDASVLHVLRDTHKRAHAHHHPVVMMGASQRVRRIFDLTGNEGLLEGGDVEGILTRFTAHVSPGGPADDGHDAGEGT